MINFLRYAPITKLLNCRIISKYHVEDLMKRSPNQSQFSIYTPAFHLFLDKVLKQQFNLKKTVRLLLQQQKLKQNNQTSKILFKHLADNVEKIDCFKTLALIFTIGFEYGWRDVDMWTKFAKKGFQLLRQQDPNTKISSFAVCKFIIAISRLVGLQKFTDQQYAAINLKAFKPLFLVYVLQLFWKDNLQDKYQMPKKLLKQLEQFQQFIPFSDMHHFLMSRRVIKDPVFKQITQKLQARITEKVQVNNVQKQQVQEQRIDPFVVQKLYNQYARDLERKYL